MRSPTPGCNKARGKKDRRAMELGGRFNLQKCKRHDKEAMGRMQDLGKNVGALGGGLYDQQKKRWGKTKYGKKKLYWAPKKVKPERNGWKPRSGTGRENHHFPEAGQLQKKKRGWTRRSDERYP